MKYINKNLPILAKDSIITADISPMWTNLHIEVFNKKICCTDGILKVLISEGWIEEVKPREYYVYDCPECVTAYREQWESGSLIKVREMIE